MKNATLQLRLMGTFLVVLVVMSMIAFSILLHARQTAVIYENGLSALVKVADMTRAIDDGARALGRLASDPDPTKAVEAFGAVEEQIYQLREELPPSTQHPDSIWLMRDLANMSDSFLIEAGAAIHALRRGDPERYFVHDREAAAIALALRDTADRLLAKELERYSQVYPEVIRRDRELQLINLVCLLILAGAATAFGWGFARSITDPVRNLADAAERIAGGDLSGPPVAVGAGPELRMMGHAFNHMQDSLRQHVTDLLHKAELERRLQAEELENLRIHSLLWQVELRALQSQVNPHFLFNTLNMVAKTALIEQAEQTRELLETVADLLRYSLRDLDRPATLQQEIDHVQRYMTIQGRRFGDRVRFSIEVVHSAVDLSIPCLTLQPLVENALIHGIGNREEGGTVSLSVSREGERVHVVIADDGEGIGPERLAALNRAEAPLESTGGHTTGLGIFNVRRRLDLYYHGAASLTVTSVPGRGTTIRLDLPVSPEGVGQFAHSRSR